MLRWPCYPNKSNLEWLPELSVKQSRLLQSGSCAGGFDESVNCWLQLVGHRVWRLSASPWRSWGTRSMHSVWQQTYRQWGIWRVTAFTLSWSCRCVYNVLSNVQWCCKVPQYYVQTALQSLSIQAFVRISYKQRIKLTIRKQYRMKPNVTSMNWTARLRQCQTTNRVGKSVRLPTTRQDSQRSVQRPRTSVAFQTSDYWLPSLAVITSMSTTTCFHISPRDQTQMLYSLFNDKCSTT